MGKRSVGEGWRGEALQRCGLGCAGFLGSKCYTWCADRGGSLERGRFWEWIASVSANDQPSLSSPPCAVDMLSVSCWPVGNSSLGRDPHLSSHMLGVWIPVCVETCAESWAAIQSPSHFPFGKRRGWQTVLELQAFCDSWLLFASDQRPQKPPAALNPQSPDPVRHLWRHPAAPKHPNNFWALIMYNWAQWAQKRLLFSAERTAEWCVWLRVPVVPRCTSPMTSPAPEWALWIPGEHTQSQPGAVQSWSWDTNLGWAGLGSGTTNPCSHWSVLRELPLHQMFVSQASPPHNHQLHLQFFNKLLNYTSLNDTLQIQQALIANDGSERLSFDCN